MRHKGWEGHGLVREISFPGRRCKCPLAKWEAEAFEKWDLFKNWKKSEWLESRETGDEAEVGWGQVSKRLSKGQLLGFWTILSFLGSYWRFSAEMWHEMKCHKKTRVSAQWNLDNLPKESNLCRVEFSSLISLKFLQLLPWLIVICDTLFIVFVEITFNFPKAPHFLLSFTILLTLYRNVISIYNWVKIFF